MVIVFALLTASNFCAQQKDIDYFAQVLEQCQSDDCKKMVDVLKHAPRVNASAVYQSNVLLEADGMKQGASDESIAEFYKKNTGKEYTKESRDQTLAEVSELYANLVGITKEGGATTAEDVVNAQRQLIANLKKAGFNVKEIIGRVTSGIMLVDPDDQKAALAVALVSYQILYQYCFESVGITLPAEQKL